MVYKIRYKIPTNHQVKFVPLINGALRYMLLDCPITELPNTAKTTIKAKPMGRDDQFLKVGTKYPVIIDKRNINNKIVWYNKPVNGWMLKILSKYTKKSG